MKLQIKLLLLALTIAGWCNVAMAQIIITTQRAADSIALLVDTTSEPAYSFRYDKTVPTGEEITDLSGFNILKKCNFIELDGFEWIDMPWFVNLKNGLFVFKNMTWLEKVSGLGRLEDYIEIDSCNRLKSYPPKGAMKSLSHLEIKNISVPYLEVDLTGLEHHKTALGSIDIVLNNNSCERIEIIDPQMVASGYKLKKNLNLKSLYVESSDFNVVDIRENPNLEEITGFKRAVSTYNNGIRYNPKLANLCAMRKSLDSSYQKLSASDKQYYPLSGNALGANSYQEMMAYDCTLGNEELTVEASEIRLFAFYANPSNGVIKLRLNEIGSAPAVLRIVNLMGEIVSVHELTQLETELDISRLRAGHYLINVRNGEKNATSRLVKVD
ncbi:MAG: T9SS type A sorting domain-containing protein [Flavobacteriales bacterium]|nr:T9SS type A sorting domain-containing protein [Flavobacteriales bacterium]